MKTVKPLGSWLSGVLAPLLKPKSKQENPDLQEDSIFGFIFQHIEIFLLIGMLFLIYALFNAFISYTSENAHFIKPEDRDMFSKTLIFGVMGVEVLLTLATSYFRKRSEWAKSFLVTTVAFVIAYYNHYTIVGIFEKYPNANGILDKMLLCNWLIFALGEIVSLLMNSKGSNSPHRYITIADLQPLLAEVKPPLYNPQGEIVQNLSPLNPIGFAPTFAYSNTLSNKDRDENLTDAQFLEKYRHVVEDWKIHNKSINAIINAYQGTDKQVSKSTIQKVKVVWRNVYGKRGGTDEV
jgi:hypothetical protein